MTVAARLRKLEAEATAAPWLVRDDPGSGFYDVAPESWGDRAYLAMSVKKGDALLIASARNLLPLLADLAEAAEQVAVLEYDPQRSAEENTELLRRATAFRAALARVAEQLDHEEGTT